MNRRHSFHGHFSLGQRWTLQVSIVFLILAILLFPLSSCQEEKFGSNSFNGIDEDGTSSLFDPKQQDPKEGEIVYKEPEEVGDLKGKHKDPTVDKGLYVEHPIVSIESKLFMGHPSSTELLADIFGEGVMKTVQNAGARSYTVVEKEEGQFCQSIKAHLPSLEQESMKWIDLKKTFEDEQARLGAFHIEVLQDSDLVPTFRSDWDPKNPNQGAGGRALEMMMAVVTLEDGAKAMHFYTNLPDPIMKRPNGLKNHLYKILFEACFSGEVQE